MIFYPGATAKGTTMTDTTKRMDYRLSVRLSDSDIALIDRAADLLGWSRTAFVREAAVRAAKVVPMDSTLLRMSPEGFEAFVQAISAPATPVLEIIASLRNAVPWEKPTQTT